MSQLHPKDWGAVATDARVRNVRRQAGELSDAIVIAIQLYVCSRRSAQYSISVCCVTD